MSRERGEREGIMSDVRFEPLVKGLLWRALYAVGRSVVLHAFYPSITVITSPIDTRSNMIALTHMHT